MAKTLQTIEALCGDAKPDDSDPSTTHSPKSDSELLARNPITLASASQAEHETGNQTLNLKPQN